MQLIADKLVNTRLFTVGIGSAPNSYFMSEAAKMGKGTFTYIGSIAQVQEKMLTLLTKLQYPALTDIELQLNSSSLQSNRQLEFYPNVISDLYKDEPLVLSYRLTAGIIEAGHSLGSGSSSGSGSSLGTSSYIDSGNDLSKINLRAQCFMG
ncbi:vault protein inter-alpha-trypsin [Paraglaciecola psychrophila]|uniref:Vault protein inter-alpha-trypsin n=1 Tax=Paraglaciecola psychrophila 170 TaxID=1129794 RepID=M4RJA6_9ALTE|nr:vault protein inter-alpha-trypsin [Paraglaciecola psychrophila]AGH42663.1 vault protein inter-alpha-trypsin [Paraglaciecola psychrophila 170]